MRVCLEECEYVCNLYPLLSNIGVTLCDKVQMCASLLFNEPLFLKLDMMQVCFLCSIFRLNTVHPMNFISEI